MSQLFNIPEEYLAVVQQDGLALQYIPYEFKTPELCLAAVERHGGALMFVPDEFKTAELCLAAVKQDGLALRLVPDDLKTAEICLAAVREYSMAIQYVPEELREEIRRLAGVRKFIARTAHELEMTTPLSAPQPCNKQSPGSTHELPLLPLRDMVVFPHMVIPLFVGRPKSLKAVEASIETDQRILLVAQRVAVKDKDEPIAEDLYSVGCIADIL